MRNTTKTQLVIAMIAVFILSACTHAITNSSTNNTNTEIDTTVTETEITQSEPDEIKTVANANAPQYIAYSEDRYNEMLGQESFALFFHADWCPTCRAMEAAITAELDTFPQGTKILKADYDEETDLKKTYGITMQSIIVVIDKDGNATKKLVNPGNKDLITAISETL